MAKEVKMVVFILERGPGHEAEGVLSRSEAEWEMSKLLSDGWRYLGAGGGSGADDLKGVGLGFALFERDLPGVEDTPLSRG
ncbi:MAG: hypothetical protein ACOCXZ_02230 [Chloroflexota bacterium]